MPPIELNPQFEKALRAMESGENVFITGRAGTGKSTLLSHFRATTGKHAVILAPTGIAAVNVKGQTIHSFFGFFPNITPEKVRKKHFKDSDNIYKHLTSIVIDEISMVRADLLDCVDKFLRLNGPSENHPFGGIQMIFIGDLYQLPPVVTRDEKHIFRDLYESPYFFSSQAFQNLEMDLIELEKIYRQKDDKFIRLLNSIRNFTCTDKDLQNLNQRLDPDFVAPLNRFYISLTSTNALADEQNTTALRKLQGKTWRSIAKIKGDFGREYYPTAQNLELKIAAQVMLLNNDSAGRWINGTIGKVVDIERKGKKETVLVAIDDGAVVEVEPFTWEIYKFELQSGKVESEIVGTFKQFPLRLAFAITIHKSQGQTFENVIIDIGRGTFAHGQMYTALSRCTSLEGLVLRQQIRPHHIILDKAVVKFLTEYQYRLAKKTLPPIEKNKLIQEAIRTQQALKITYLKANDEKSIREITPIEIGQMEYAQRFFLGLHAYCHSRSEERIFNVERILKIEKGD
jgi:ATP-dependent exoDNAse (exonuclease V) alpha subunit